MSLTRIRPALQHAARNLGRNTSLAELAARSGLSAFHLHRIFSRTLGETPKRLTLRLRLGRAAALLLTTRRSVLDIALACGFESHEVFARAFRQHFHLSPSGYRSRGFRQPLRAVEARRHAELTDEVGRCIRLYRLNLSTQETDPMSYAISKRVLTPQPVLMVTRRVKQSEIAAAIGGSMPVLFGFAQQHGIAIAGHPITRYVEVGPGLMTIEPALKIVDGADKHVPDSEVRIETLPGGPAACTTHVGPYDSLPEAWAAVQKWIEEQGLTPAGAPWEDYVTDPADVPDPRDWKTDIFWPVR